MTFDRALKYVTLLRGNLRFWDAIFFLQDRYVPIQNISQSETIIELGQS